MLDKLIELPGRSASGIGAILTIAFGFSLLALLISVSESFDRGDYLLLEILAGALPVLAYAIMRVGRRLRRLP